MKFKKWFYIMVALTGISAAGCGEKIEPGTTTQAPGKTLTAPLGVVRISQEPFIYEAVGNVQAKTFSTLSSKLMGTVNQIWVKEGDKVVQGDALVKIDDREVSAKLHQAKAALSEAQRGFDAAVSEITDVVYFITTSTVSPTSTARLSGRSFQSMNSVWS